jgi:hypothetical protein
LQQIERASRFQYLLGYYPTATHAPDVHRSVRVEVARRDVTAQYRHGYRLAPSAGDETEFRAAAADYRLRTHLAWLTEPSPQRRPAGLTQAPALRITSERVTGPGATSAMKVGLAFNPARVSFAGDDTSRRVMLHVAVVLDNAEGNPVGELTRTVELALTGDDIARARTQWIAFDVTVPFEGEPAHVRAAIYDYDHDSSRGAMARVAQRR